MKVSIITMTCTYNYGATLQAYALQQYIEKLGHNCNVIDHMGWNGHRKVLSNGITKDTLLKIPYIKLLEDGYLHFENFYKNKMHMTKRYKSIEELHISPPDSDAFVTGSDQVWNPRDFRKEFYLDFVNEQKIKISYAASIGINSIPENIRINIQELLKSFKAISVREVSAFESIQKLTKIQVNKNCDPVFLISKDEWRTISKPLNNIPEDYILCYMIYKPNWINSWLMKIKKKTGKKIVVVGLNGFRPIVCDKYIRNAGPEEFIWLFDNSSGIISSSFHGIAFSILFNKPFIALPDPPRPDRICNLVNMFNLNDRILFNDKIDNILMPYNENNVKEIIEFERNRSTEYLSNSLQIG
jgi:hypothetical protein